MPPFRASLAVAYILLVLLGLPPPAAGAEATLNLDVPAGKWKAIRLRDLPQGALVAVAVEATGKVVVALVDADNLARFPAVTRPLFRAQVDRRLTFSVAIPAAGNYFVVLDNRSGEDARAVELTVEATRGKRGAASEVKPQALPEERKNLAAAEEKLREFGRDLHQVFIFEQFPIQAKACGAPKAFSGEFGIVLCQEYAQKLYATLGDKAKAADALLFTLFHEVAHVLLEQWGYPFAGNEDVADEFATAVMIMLGQQERVRAKAEYFAKNPSLAEAMVKAFRDDRHSLSAQRARNILRWADDPTLVREWQTIFVPHMQTALLERLRQKPAAWTDLALVEKELAARR
jgi:hypothetical protein